MIYFFEIWIGNIVHGGNPLYSVVDCFRHSRGLKWPIWTKFFACGIFYVYDGHPLKFLSIFFYSDPLKKVVLSEVGAFPKMLYYNIFGVPLQIIFSFFVRWEICDQEGYNCNIISEMNTNIIKKSCQESSSKVKQYWQHFAIHSSSI